MSPLSCLPTLLVCLVFQRSGSRMVAASRFGRLHFTRVHQEALIQGHGEACLIFPVLTCPCLLADHQFSPNCPTCKGTGRFYPPHLAYSTTLLLVHEHSLRTYNDPGTWIPGTIQATILPGIRLAERDKVRRIDALETFTDEVLTRGLDDTLRFSAGVRLDLVADRERVYRAGVDYALTSPGTVTWLPGGHSPAFMAQYSVKYSAHPEYLSTPDNPRTRLEQRRGQAQMVVLTRLDYVVEGG